MKIADLRNKHFGKPVFCLGTAPNDSFSSFFKMTECGILSLELAGRLPLMGDPDAQRIMMSRS